MDATTAPSSPGRPRWRDMFASFQVPNYRLYCAGQIVQTTSGGMQRIAQDWIVLQLTGNVADVGVTMMLQFAPMLLFGLFGGVIADRYPKLRTLQVTQSVMAASAATIAVLMFTDTISVWELWGAALLSGFTILVDQPTRQAFASEVVGPRLLPNALSLNSSTYQLGFTLGPALGGVLLAAVGGGWSFVINAIACVGTIVVLALLDRTQLHTAAPGASRKGQLSEGLAFVARTPRVLLPLVVLLSVSVFAYTMPVLLTAFADRVYHVGSSGYGFFNAFVALGSVAGALLGARRGNVALRTVITGGVVYGLLQALTGGMTSIVAFGVLLVATGVSSLLYFTATNSLVQLSTEPRLRGRVMGLFGLVQFGGQAFGGPIMGWVVDAYGPHVGMVLSGLVPLVTAIVVGAVVLKRGGSSLRGTVRSAVDVRGWLTRGRPHPGDPESASSLVE